MISEGLLLYCDPKLKQTLDQKVQDAIDYYKRTYNIRPTQIHVHPSLYDGRDWIAGVKILKNRTVIAEHLWAGIGEPK